MLGYFKYVNFFAASLQVALAKAGINVPLWHINVVLPIGISFYTFQSMSYVIDVYRKDIKPTKNLLEFATFVSFFPHLVAGPIMRPTTLLPQIQSPAQVPPGTDLSGGLPDLLGADQEGGHRRQPGTWYVNDLFGRWQTIDGGLASAGHLCVCVPDLLRFFGLHRCRSRDRQVPGDRACPQLQPAVLRHQPARILEPLAYQPVEVAPGLSVHTRSGGSRGGTFLTYRNLMLTMIIGGLWHGAAWTFVIWGTYQGDDPGWAPAGQAVAGPKIQPDARRSTRLCWKAVRIFCTFHLVCLGWLIFRSTGSPPEDEGLGRIPASSNFSGCWKRSSIVPRSRRRATCCR